MKRVACYVRVSTQEQKNHGLSVDSQIVALEEYCKEHDYILVKVYNDAGISARKRYTKRPALLELIDDCKEGKIDLIIFTKLDRWFRSVADYYEVQSQLDLYGVPWRAIWEDYETETSSGVFKVNIMLSVAQSEADRTSERIKSVFEYQRAKGDYVGCAPYGYKRQDHKLVKDPEAEEAVKIVFDTFLTTRSSSACMRALINKGYTMSRNGVTRILTNSAYYGDCNGYSCEPYITLEDHNRIMEIRKSNYRTPKGSNMYLFSGICFCSLCGCRMRTVTNKSLKTEYKGYYCTGIDGVNKHDVGVYVSQKKIETYLLKNIEAIVENYNVSIESRSVKPDQAELDRTKKALEAKLERVGIRFEDGDITAEEYRSKRKAILLEITSLQSVKPSSAVTLPDNWREAYDLLDEDHKRMFWSSIISQIKLHPKNDPLPDIIFLS